MQLKRISLQGFKSFADPVTLDLGPGITAVVGPNGSGKSNVVEAVRWVLGEQSARRLRGYRMDDLIFAGSRRRRPVNLAEVTLVVEDEDGHLGSEYPEVSLTRRVDREGTAEFFINRAPCRLRDIQELFFHTGLGRASYALVGQGELGLIITGRPEDRGAMVEEVAGLTRVRERITLVRRRVARLEPSRDRLGDMLSGMEARLEPLRVQARQARRHEDLSGRLRTLERSLQLHRLALLGADAGSREGQCSRLSEQLERERASLAAEREAASTARKGLDAAAAELEQLRRAVGRGQGRYQDALHQVRSAELRLETLATESGRLGQDLDASWSRWLKLRGQRTDGMGEEIQLSAAVAEITAELGSLERQAASIQAEVDRHPADADGPGADIRRRLRETDQAAARAGQIVSSGEEGLVALARRLDDISQSAVRAAHEERKVARDLEQVEGQLVETGVEAARVGSDLEAVAADLEENRRQQESLDRERGATLARLEAQAEMERLGAGYGEGTRFLLGMDRDRGQEARPGIVGTVGQVIRPRPGYEAVLEAVLEATASDLLVDSMDAARGSIRALRDAGAGRATFWVGSGGKTARDRIPSECLDLPGLVATGPDLVDPGCAGASLAAALLGDLLVFGDLSAVPDHARLERWGVRAATMDGDMAFPGGMRGGSRQQGVWTRRRDVHELGEKLSALKSRLEDLTATGRDLEGRQESLASTLQGLRASRQALEVKRDLYRQQLEECGGRLAEARRQRTEAMAEIEKLKADVASAREDLAEVTGTRAELEDSIRRLEQERASREEARRRLLAQLDQARDQVSKMRAELESRRGRLEVRRSWNEGLSRDVLELARTRGALIERVKSVAAEQRAHEETLDRLRGQAEAFRESLEGDQARLPGRESAVRSGEQELFRLETGAQATEERLSRLEARLHREELALARVATELAGARQLLTERGVPEAEMDVATALDNPEDASEGASALREEIAAMGVVNPLAVEECSRLEARYGTLKAACDDLLAAAGDVDWIRGHLERDMRRVFLDVLGEIDARFGRSFERLFGGGEAGLLLCGSEQEDQVPGIDVVAQPPGKKLQHLSLLSGGERALTATAFLFALLDFLPAPFVIFDEIDAALDERNVKLFGDCLRDLSQRTQIVIVTHQRGTMEGADMLYGTTMDESGVTQVVPVRLSEVEAGQV